MVQLNNSIAYIGECGIFSNIINNIGNGFNNEDEVKSVQKELWVISNTFKDGRNSQNIHVNKCYSSLKVRFIPVIPIAAYLIQFEMNLYTSQNIFIKRKA